MDERESAVMLTANIVRQYLPTDGELEDVIKAAFDCVHDDDKAWMLADEDAKLLAGTGAVLIYYKDNDDMRERIEAELTVLRALSAATTGIPVDFGRLLNNELEPVGLLNAFRKAKERAEGLQK